MRVLIFHGYLLGGTGSNVYTARLAQALAGLGHEVHLICQERHPQRLGFVDAVGDWESGELSVQALQGRSRARCTVYRPDIDGLLPVYVQDRYEGLQARTFAACSEAEVERYLQANVSAVERVAELVRPDIALANHLVMGPAILARALSQRIPYAVKVHGSALEYTVKPDLPRFLPFARDGLAAARAVLVGSRHTAESLWAALGEDWVQAHGLRDRTRLGPPGVDVHAFGPRERRRAAAGLAGLAERLEGASGGACGARGAPAGACGARGAPAGACGASGAVRGGSGAEAADADVADSSAGASASEQTDAFAREEARAARALRGLDPADGPIVVYVGKLIVSKGVDLLLAAWPLVLERFPAARLVIVGFGAFQAALEDMVADLAAGRIDALREIAQAGRELEGGPRAPLSHLQAFLSSLRQEGQERYCRAAGLAACSVRFTGRLDHEELVDLLPACDAIVVPSTFPEAFGMVAVEAAACGVLPISAAHSGLAEVTRRLAGAVGEPVAGWLSFPVDDRSVTAVAERLVGWLSAEPQTRQAAAEAIVETVRRLWSWEGVADGVIAAAQGRVEHLARP
jgi:glycosyltransferase involved in cell wall biosynthesis